MVAATCYMIYYIGEGFEEALVAPAPAEAMSMPTFNWHASAQSRLPACTRRLNEVHAGRRRILLDGFNDFPPGALHILGLGC